MKNSRAAHLREHRPHTRRSEPRRHREMCHERRRTGAAAAPGACRTRNAERRRRAREDERQTDESEYVFPRLVIGELEGLHRRAAYAFRLSP